MILEDRSSMERRSVVSVRTAGLLFSALLAGFPIKGLALAPEAAAVQNELYLELVINSVSTGALIPVVNQGDRYFVAVSDLKGAGLPIAANFEKIDVAHFPRLSAEYDSLGQRLLLSVPSSWLPQQHIGRNVSFERARPVSGTGVMLNYDAYTATTSNDGYSGTSVWSELRAFGEFGIVSSTGIYRHSPDDQVSEHPGNGRYVRYDTTWTYADDDRVLTWELGDYVTRAQTWTGSTRMAGLQVSRDFSLRPDIITFPLPTFYGDASIPSTVDLFINGYKASSNTVDPGPFVLSSVPYINGAGEAVIVTTDALGRKVSTTMPFYVNGQLLREGLSDFSMAAGALRKDYGLKDFSYGEGAANASWRYGLTNAITMETNLEAADGLYNMGLGTLFSIGSFGDVNLSSNQSKGDFGDGSQYAYGYRYSGRGYTFSARQTVRNEEFRSLSTYDIETSQYSTRKTSQVNGSLSLGRYGNIGAGYFDLEAFDESRTRLVSVSWNKPVWRNTSLYLTASKELGEPDFATTAQFMVPLDLMGTASMTLERTQDGRKSARVNYAKAAPTEGGLGWGAGYGYYDSGDDYKRFDVTWRNKYNQLQAGFYGAEDRSYWAGATGSVIVMDGMVYPSNRIHDAFVLVSTDGQEGVPVRYENQLIGKTNDAGHILIPWASSSYAGKYEVDPSQLDGNIDVPLTEQRVAVKSGSGYLMRFPMQRMISAMVTLVNGKGEVIPVGSYVTAAGGQGAYVGWDGQVYLEGLADKNDLLVRIAGSGTCRASFKLDAKIDQIAQVGPLVCQN